MNQSVLPTTAGTSTQNTASHATSKPVNPLLPGVAEALRHIALLGYN